VSSSPLRVNVGSNWGAEEGKVYGEGESPSDPKPELPAFFVPNTRPYKAETIFNERQAIAMDALSMLALIHRK
jgi:hypothetical protein